MRQPSLSVIVPFHNSSATLKRCVDSLTGQSNTGDIEFIFIDDASTDNSLEVLKESLSGKELSFSPIIIRNETNKGISFNRATGLERSSGEYIIFCDSDDYVEPEMYGLLLNEAVREKADIVNCGFFYHYDGNCVIHDTDIKAGDRDTYLKQISGMVGETRHCALWNKLIKRDVALKGSFPAGVNMLEDACFLMSILKEKDLVVRQISKPLYHYIASYSSITKSRNLKLTMELAGAGQALLKQLEHAEEDLYIAALQSKIAAVNYLTAYNSLNLYRNGQHEFAELLDFNTLLRALPFNRRNRTLNIFQKALVSQFSKGNFKNSLYILNFVKICDKLNRIKRKTLNSSSGNK